ncbi:type II CRISPR RNA-guided endonuclease Cas9 [Mesomycoplasma ovipneumoniae]|uniref:type II CRISPR RNA-guided endonuclease Cas9 n=1 Tax=Mesomycoplasma ovipneumoniae TaxID=29562 RepID=UPI00311CC840
MNQKKSIAIGFDLGIASVGWAIINSETNEILNWGSRIFEERKQKDAADRRLSRTARRTIRRRQYKNEKLLKLILRSKNIFDFKNIDEIKNSFLKSSSQNSNILDLKIKALNEKIDPKDFAWILHDYLQNRGYFYELDKKDKKGKNYNGDKLPTEVLSEFFKKNNFFKSSKHNFSNQQWTVEIKKVFEVQNIDEEFQKNFLRLFNYIRDFAKGPGSLHSASEYGVWKFDKEKDEIVEKYENIWDKTIGKCSIYPDQLRASLNFVSYEFFNLLNELSNLRSEFDPEWRLKKEDRDNLINELLSSKTESIDVNKIEEIIYKDLDSKISDNDKISDDDFKGTEILKNKVDISEKLDGKTKNTNILIKEITNHSEKYKDFKVKNFVDHREHLEALDSICSVLQKYKESLQRYKENLQRYKEKKDRFIEELDKTRALNHFEIINKKDDFINSLLNNKELTFKKTGSYSAKATRLFVEKMLKTQENSEYLKYNDKEINDIIKQNTKGKPLTKYLNPFIFENEILPPSVKQTFEQAIAVLNKIIKKYSKDHEISGIFIEIPREKNNQGSTTIKSDLNKIYNFMKEKYSAELEKISRKDLDDKPAALLKKLKFYCQQGGFDLYKLDKINIKELINDSSEYHFDHIIPRAYLPDNSWSNLLLTKRDQNLNKSNLSAAAYMRSKGNVAYNDYVQKIENLFNPNTNKSALKANVSKILGLDKKSMLKKLKLLYQEEVDPHQREEFLSRNLNDTRYSTKLFLEVVKEHFKDNPNFSYNQPTKIFTLNGHHIASIRERNPLYKTKDRSDNSHHAIDAAIIAITANKNRHALSSLTIQEGLQQSKYERTEDSTIINKQTGEILKLSNYESKKFELLENISNLVNEKIENAKAKIQIKFSRKITNSTNSCLFDDTLYGLRKNDDGTYDKIEKINLVTLKSKDKKTKEYFADPNPNDGKYLVLMYQSHKSEFDKLRTIFNSPEFNKETYPFQAYMEWLVSKNYIDKEEKENAIGVDKLIYIDPKTKRKTLFKDLKVVTERNVNKDFEFVNKKQGEKSFRTGKTQLFALVYENKKSQLSSIPVNFLLKKFGSKLDRKFYSLDESNYNQENLKKYKDNLGIDYQSKPIFIIKKSAIVKIKVDKEFDFESENNKAKTPEEKAKSPKKSILIRPDDNYYFYISGITKKKNGKDTSFTIKSVSFDKLKQKELQTQSLLNEFQFISLDELGNEYESNEQKKIRGIFY